MRFNLIILGSVITVGPIINNKKEPNYIWFILLITISFKSNRIIICYRACLYTYYYFSVMRVINI